MRSVELHSAPSLGPRRTPQQRINQQATCTLRAHKVGPARRSLYVHTLPGYTLSSSNYSTTRLGMHQASSHLASNHGTTRLRGTEVPSRANITPPAHSSGMQDAQNLGKWNPCPALVETSVSDVVEMEGFSCAEVPQYLHVQTPPEQIVETWARVP